MTDEIQWSDLRLHDGGECPVELLGEHVKAYERFKHLNMAIAETWSGLGCEGFWHTVVAYQVQIKSQRKMVVPWHVLPPEYDHAYKGPDRTAFAYDGHGNMIRIDQLVGYEPGDDPWGLQSLVKRPEAAA